MAGDTITATIVPMGEVDFNRRLGANVARFRRAGGLSQSDLATRLTERGLPFQQQTVLKVEKGARPLRAEELFALSEILGAPMTALTAWQGEAGEKLLQFKAANSTLRSLVAQRDDLERQIQAYQLFRKEVLDHLVAALEAEDKPKLASTYLWIAQLIAKEKPGQPDWITGESELREYAEAHADTWDPVAGTIDGPARSFEELALRAGDLDASHKQQMRQAQAVVRGEDTDA